MHVCEVCEGLTIMVCKGWGLGSQCLVLLYLKETVFKLLHIHEFTPVEMILK